MFLAKLNFLQIVPLKICSGEKQRHVTFLNKSTMMVLNTTFNSCFYTIACHGLYVLGPFKNWFQRSAFFSFFGVVVQKDLIANFHILNFSFSCFYLNCLFVFAEQLFCFLQHFQ